MWHPLDVLKTRMQVQGARLDSSPSYSSVRHALVTMARTEGARGFFQGVWPSIIGSAAGWGLQMPLYNALKRQSAQAFDTVSHRPNMRRDLLCSFASGCLTTVVVHPFYMLKTRLQLQSVTSLAHPSPYRGFLHALVSVGREEGVRGYYRGFGPSLMLSSHGAILLMSYDQFKEVCPSTLVASLFAKVFASVSTYPVQVVRSVMQQRPIEGQLTGLKLIPTIKALWHHDGLFAFYRGLSVQMMRTVPQAMAFFSVYEVVLAQLTHIWTAASCVPAPALH